MEIFSIVNDYSKKNYDVEVSKNVQNSSKINESDLNSDSEKKEKLSKEDIIKMINEINQELQKTLNTALEFKYNDKVNELIVQVIDKKNNKVIREFPPREALKLMEKMRELVGMLFDRKG
jgi:flagellar protein FlaG